MHTRVIYVWHMLAYLLCNDPCHPSQSKALDWQLLFHRSDAIVIAVFLFGCGVKSKRREAVGARGGIDDVGRVFLFLSPRLLPIAYGKGWG